MFCSSCGKEIGKGSHFCAFCGTEVVLPNPSGSHECSNTPDYTIDELLESVRRGKGGKGFLTDSTAIRNAIWYIRLDRILRVCLFI